MTDRTDAERFAWLFEHDGTSFFTCNEVSVDYMASKGNGNRCFPEASRVVRSKSRVFDAWRKCVDELMDKEAKA